MHLDIDVLEQVKRKRAELLRNGDIKAPQLLSENKELHKTLKSMESAEKRKRKQVVII